MILIAFRHGLRPRALLAEEEAKLRALEGERKRDGRG
jgi:hypothetical protein